MVHERRREKGRGHDVCSQHSPGRRRLAEPSEEVLGGFSADSPATWRGGSACPGLPEDVPSSLHTSCGIVAIGKTRSARGEDGQTAFYSEQRPPRATRVITAITRCPGGDGADRDMLVLETGSSTVQPRA